MFRATSVLLSLALLVSEVAVAAPPGTVVCDNPAVQPALIVHWAPISAQNVSSAAFDSAHVFVASLLGGIIQRFALNGENLETWTVADLEQPSHLAICPTTGQLYVNDFNWPGVPYDQRLWVFDPDGTGTPDDILFSGARSMAPGGIVNGPAMFAFHPVTGSLYVLDEGWYVDQGDSTWVSRVQRFGPTGTYEGFVINNMLGHPPGQNPGAELPQCGSWRFANWLYVDASDNVYLTDLTLGGGVPALHKFTGAGACEDVWDLAAFGGDAARFAVDADGYFYTFEGDTLRKWTNGFGQLVYERDMSGPVLGMTFMPGSSEFLLAVIDLGADRRVELLGPQIEPLNIIGEDWQETSPPFQLVTSDLNALTACDGTRRSMAGVAADGVSPLLLRWKVPGPGTVEWLLLDAAYPSETSLLGTLASLDSSEVDTVTIS